MNNTHYALYQKLRKEYPTLPAKWALRCAKEEERYPHIEWDFHDLNAFASVYLEGFLITLKIEVDENYDWWDFRGHFTDRWQPGAIRNPESIGYEGHRFKWFLPAINEAEHYKGLRQMHFGKAEAHVLSRRYVREEMQIARDPYAAGLEVFGVTAVASANHVEVGVASLWGIEVTHGISDTYLTSCAWDVAYEAVQQAKEQKPC